MVSQKITEWLKDWANEIDEMSGISWELAFMQLP